MYTTVPSKGMRSESASIFKRETIHKEPRDGVVTKTKEHFFEKILNAERILSPAL